MKYIIAQIAGMGLFALGLQGGIRLLSNSNDPGFLAALPGDISLKLGLYAAIATAGGYVMGWAYKKWRDAS